MADPNQFGDLPVQPAQANQSQVNQFGDAAAPTPQSGQAAYAPQAPQTWGHAADQFLSSINPFPFIASAVTDPVGTAKNLYQASADQAKKAGESYQKGDYSEYFGHSLGTLAPGVAAIGEQIGGSAPTFDKYGNVIQQGQQPDVAGGLARAAGTIGSIAAAPAASRAVGSALKATGRTLGKTALGLQGKSQAFGATPSQALMEDTSGIRPSTIARTGQEQLNTLKPQMEAEVGKATNTVDLSDARQTIADAKADATKQGNKALYAELDEMDQALQGNRITGNPYPVQMSAADALDLKRGFGDEFAKFNPELHEMTNAIAKKVYGQLAEAIHNTAPGSQEMDQSIQSLIPVVRRAQTVSRGADLGQRIANRMSKPTIMPGYLGYAVGGLPGAAAGIAGAETLGSPEALMTAARGTHAMGTAAASQVAQRAAQIAPIASQTLTSESLAKQMGKQVWNALGGPPVQ
jgi:hypothetical protein